MLLILLWISKLVLLNLCFSMLSFSNAVCLWLLGLFFFGNGAICFYWTFSIGIFSLFYNIFDYIFLLTLKSFIYLWNSICLNIFSKLAPCMKLNLTLSLFSTVTVYIHFQILLIIKWSPVVIKSDFSDDKVFNLKSLLFDFARNLREGKRKILVKLL